VTKPKSINSLTGLRFFAAISVVIAHYADNAHYTILGLNLDTAALGMPLFFTLSGFVIHYVYSQEFAGSWSSAARSFAAARCSRLYPLFLFFFAYFVLFGGLDRMLSYPTVTISYLGLTASWWYWLADDKALAQWPYGLTWSISTEWFFYLCYALGLFRLHRVRTVRTLVLAIAALSVTAYLLNLYVYIHIWLPELGGRFGFWLVYISPYMHMFEFLAGCLICQLYLNLRGQIVTRRANEIIFWTGLAWVAVLLALYLKTASGAPWASSSRLFDFIAFLHMTYLLVPGIVLMILALALGNCAAARFLAAAPLVFLGDISYSIYLGHTVAGALTPVGPDSAYPELKLFAGLAFVCFFAAGLYLCIEVPSKRMLRKVFTAKPLVLAGAAPVGRY